MADINSVMLIGRLTRDAELKYTATGQAVCKFSIAVNRRKKNGDVWEDEPSFFDIVVWGRQGESINQYLVKGKLVGIQGELRQDRWTQEGQNRSKVEVIANNIQLLGGNNGTQGAAGGQGGAYHPAGDAGMGGAPSYRPAAPAGGSAAPDTGHADDSFADDIPF
ncbi:MAG: single-stranded DNA-binding protein [Spirochaetaceae bacterium]|jgi:single-strand DNA-binding protein|nr:single-stranded DNA-binding protein [Spirochaetaceae bacterium]